MPECKLYQMDFIHKIRYIEGLADRTSLAFDRMQQTCNQQMSALEMQLCRTFRNALRANIAKDPSYTFTHEQ